MKSLVRKSPAKASRSALFVFAVFAALAAFSAEGCLQSSEDGAAGAAALDSLAHLDSLRLDSLYNRLDSIARSDSLSRLDSLRGIGGVWMLTRAYYAYTDNGTTDKDTMVYDTSDVYMRAFYVIHGGALFWVSYSDPENEYGSSSGVYLTPLRQIDSLRWVAGTHDTLKIVRNGDRLIISTHQSGYDYYGGDSVLYEESNRIEAVAYTGSFPPPQWYEPPPSESEPNNSRDQAIPLSVSGNASSGTLTAGDEDWYSFQATQGQGYQIETQGNTDTFLELYGAGADPLTEDDDGGDGSNALVYWVCPASGTYYVRVSGFDEVETGAYKVLITKYDAGLLQKKAAGSGRMDIPDLLRPPKRR